VKWRSKILPGEFAQDSDRVSRFQREAEVLASLNHPNIAAMRLAETLLRVVSDADCRVIPRIRHEQAS